MIFSAAFVPKSRRFFCSKLIYAVNLSKFTICQNLQFRDIIFKLYCVRMSGKVNILYKAVDYQYCIVTININKLFYENKLKSRTN